MVGFIRLAAVRMLCVEETKSVQLMTSQQWWAGPTAKLNVFCHCGHTATSPPNYMYKMKLNLPGVAGFVKYTYVRVRIHWYSKTCFEQNETKKLICHQAFSDFMRYFFNFNVIKTKNIIKHKSI